MSRTLTGLTKAGGMFKFAAKRLELFYRWSYCLSWHEEDGGSEGGREGRRGLRAFGSRVHVPVASSCLREVSRIFHLIIDE